MDKMAECTIIGVRHQIEQLLPTLAVMRAELAKRRGPVKIAIERTNTDANDGLYWRLLINKLRKRKRVEIIFIDSQYARDLSHKTEALSEKLAAQQNAGVPAEELKQLEETVNKGDYIKDIIRSRLFARQIRKHQPDIAIMGGMHAIRVAKMLRTKPLLVPHRPKELQQLMKLARREYGLLDARRRIRKKVIRRAKLAAF